MPRIRKVRVLSAALPITFLILAGTAYADPLLAESMGLDVWEIGRLEQDLKTSQARGDRLEVELQGLHDMIAVNEVIAADVVAGRVTLPVAARQKWEVNRSRVALRDHLDRRYSGATYEEKMAQDLYHRIADERRDDATFGPVLARLKAEYAAAYHAPLPPSGW